MMGEDVRVLIVDDEAIIRVSLTALLQEDDYVVDAVESGEKALEKINEEDWDILLIDIKMPGMDGLELQERVKKIKPDIPVLIMTAYATVDTAVKAMKDGAEDYIVKPFNPDELKLTLRKIVEHKRVVEENIRLRQQLKQSYGARYICKNCGQEMVLKKQYE